LLVAPFLWGMLADRYLPLNRVFTLLNLLACAALGSLAGQTTFAGMLLGFAFLTACLNPTFNLLNALSFHHLSRPLEQFGALRAWGSLGWIVPFLPISLWLAGHPRTPLDFVLFLSMGLCLIMCGISLKLPHTPPQGRSGSGRHIYGPALRRLLRDPNYVTLLVAYLLVAGSFSLYVFYSPPFLEDLGVRRAWLGPIQAVGVLFELLLFRWQAALVRRWNYATVILIGCLALLVRQAMFSALSDVWLLTASYLLAAMVVVFHYIGTSVLVNAIAAPEVRATAQTLLVLCGSGLGPMGANWAAGRLAAHFANDLRPVFLFAAALCGAAALLLAARARPLNRAGRGGG
jgi:MFS family permease